MITIGVMIVILNTQGSADAEGRREETTHHKEKKTKHWGATLCRVL
jgi:hypothetical protein